MKKVLLWLLVLIITIGMVATVSFTGCKKEVAEKTTTAETVAGKTTTAETKAAGETTAAGKPFKGVILNVVNMLGWTVTEPVWKHLAEFEEKTGIKVVLNEMPGADLRTKQMLEGENKTGAYDVLQMYDLLMPILYKYCLPLDDYLTTAYGSVDNWSKALFPSVVKTSTFENKVFFAEFMGGAQIVFYRKQLFDDPKEQKAFKAEYGYDLKPPTT
ncbi:MAG: extracellular solute-binding protein, partial [Actinobacteria bacterium]|nr:extracellular solute-binding protein [Actinomycetota bacterium]